MENQPRRSVRWKMNLSFNSEDTKREFQEKMDRAKRSVCPGRTLDNFQFLSFVLQGLESTSETESRSTVQAKIMLTLDLREVCNRLWKARCKWYHIGIGLNISESDLNAIQKSKRYEVGDCLIEMFSQWLRAGNPRAPPSWKVIIEAIRAPLVGYHHLAEEIEQSVYGHSLTDKGAGQGTQGFQGQNALSASRRPCIDDKPTIEKLRVLQTPKGTKIRIIDELATSCSMFGDLLSFDDQGFVVEFIKKSTPDSQIDCCRTIFQYWISGCGVRPCTWGKLIELIKDCQREAFAEEIEVAVLSR